MLSEQPPTRPVASGVRPARGGGRWKGLVDLLRYVIHVDSLLALGVLSLLLSVLEWIGTLPFWLSGGAFLLARLVWVTYFFLVARKAALGKRRLPTPSDHLDIWDTLILPLYRALWASSWFWIALVLFVAATVGFWDYIERFQAHAFIFLSQQGLAGILMLTGAICYLPSCALGVLCGLEAIACADPRVSWRLAAREHRRYLAMFSTLCAFGVIGFALDLITGRLQISLPIPLAAPVLSHLLRLWVPLLQARLVGGFVFENGAALRGAR